MNTIIVLLALSTSCVIAAPAEAGSGSIQTLPALIHEEIHDELGQYSLHYVTADGTIVIEKGRLVPNPDGTGRVMVMEGEVTYIGDDGKTYNTKYTAGFDGFNAKGDHLMVNPPVPVVEVVEVLKPVPAAVEVVEVLKPVPAAVEVIVV